MIPEIEGGAVNVRHWRRQVVEEVVPGRIAVALAVGYRVAGWCNALTAIVGAFWRSFPMRWIAEVFINRLRTNPQVQAFFSGIAPAILGMSAAAAASLARSGLDSTLSFGVATTAFLLMLRARLNPVVILIGCGGLQFAVAHYLF